MRRRQKDCCPGCGGIKSVLSAKCAACATKRPNDPTVCPCCGGRKETHETKCLSCIDGRNNVRRRKRANSAYRAHQLLRFATELDRGLRLRRKYGLTYQDIVCGALAMVYSEAGGRGSAMKSVKARRRAV